MAAIHSEFWRNHWREVSRIPVRGARSILIDQFTRHLPAFLFVLVAALASPLFAQVSGGGGITTKPLDPLKPSGDAAAQDSASRFKKAPFKTAEIPRQPVPIEPVGTVLQAGARMRQLDKMTGRIQTFEIAAGSEKLVDRLRVRLDACRSPEDNSQHGSMAFVQIWDTKLAEAPPVFSGWMFAESPALSALDHPRYDLWVINCTTSPGEPPAASE